MSRALSAVARRLRAPAPGPVAEQVDDAPAAVCSICESTEFEDYNGPRRRCSRCGSVERQRVLAQVYDEFMSRELPLKGKSVLVIATSSSELSLIKRRGGVPTTLDVRPDAKPDVLADVCAMPEVASSTFDVIVASFVLAYVHDVDAALAEFARVLRPGGALLVCEQLQLGTSTIEHPLDKATGWYGEDAFERHRVAHFRRFGDLDLLDLLAQRFVPKTFYGRDAPTGKREIWILGRRRDA